MKIIYISNIRFPTHKAHGLQIAKTCEAFGKQNIDIELLIPWRFNPLKENGYDFYDIKYKFPIRKIFSIDLLWLPLCSSITFLLQLFSFALSIFFIFLFRQDKNIVVYGRDEMVLAPLALIGLRVFWESHTGSNNFFVRVLKNKKSKIVCISKGLADFYNDLGFSVNDILVAPDGVDLSLFDNIRDSKAQLRDELGLSRLNRVITYSGSVGLYAWKGVDVFLDSLKYLESKDVQYLVVGGVEDEILKLKNRYSDPRIIFVGQVPVTSVPSYLLASDVLVLPNKTGHIVSDKFTSPMKLFEYMLSGVPIVASNVASIQEILSEESAYLFLANDPVDLAHKIETALNNTIESNKRTAKASVLVQRFSWDIRVKTILNFIIG